MCSNIRALEEIIAMMAPAMRLPSRHTLANVVLKRVKNEIRLSVIQLIIQPLYVSLVTDGFSDPNSSSIIMYMVVASGMPSVVWSSWSTRSKPRTADYLVGEIENVIAEIEQDTQESRSSAWDLLLV